MADFLSKEWFSEAGDTLGKIGEGTGRVAAAVGTAGLSEVGIRKYQYDTNKTKEENAAAKALAEPSAPPPAKGLDEILAAFQDKALANSDKIAREGIAALNASYSESLPYFQKYAEAGDRGLAGLEKWKAFVAPEYKFDSQKVLDDPVVQWQLKQAERSSNNQLASKGILGGGRAEALRIGNRNDVLSRATNDVFNRDFNSFNANTQNSFNTSDRNYNQLSGLANMGQTANSAIATNRMNLGSNVASTLQGLGAQTTGIIGQGQQQTGQIGMNRENQAFMKQMDELKRQGQIDDRVYNLLTGVISGAAGAGAAKLAG